MGDIWWALLVALVYRVIQAAALMSYVIRCRESRRYHSHLLIVNEHYFTVKVVKTFPSLMDQMLP